MPKPYDPNERDIGYSQVVGSEDFTLDSSTSSRNHGLHDSLMGPEPGASLPVTAATAMMQVTAPATLPEGYEFDARIGERTVTVTVPEGGVEKGQTLTVPLPATVEQLITGSISIPVGHWRDGLFDIFKHGACHPAVWASCCCHLCTYSINMCLIDICLIDWCLIDMCLIH